MENLIFEGGAKAFGVLILAYAVYTSAQEVNLRKILDAAFWRRMLTILYWLGGILIASFMISGFLNYSTPDIEMTAFLFVLMVGAGMFGLKTNKLYK